MEHTLMWGSLALGGAGWICLFLLALARPDAVASASTTLPVKRPFLWLALVVPVFVWLATLPTSPPFSSGQGFGRGCLLGGFIAFGSALVMLHAVPVAPRRATLIFQFGALIVVCVPLLAMRHAVIEALLGASFGWSAVSLLLLFGRERGDEETPVAFARTSPGVPDWAATSLLNGTAFATTLCAAAALGVFRDFAVADLARGTYSSVAVALATAIAFSLLTGVLLGELALGSRSLQLETSPNQVAAPERLAGARLTNAVTTLLCLLVPLGLGYWLAMRVLDDLQAFYAVGVGVGLSLLSQIGMGERKEGGSLAVPAAPVLVALCAFLFAFGLMQGFGVGLMLLGAWPASLLALPSASSVLPASAQTTTSAQVENAPGEESGPRLVRMTMPSTQTENALSNGEQARCDWAQAITLLGTFLAILLVSRLFATRFRVELRGAGFSDQFALFGFVAGAVLPAFLSSLALGSGTQTRVRSGVLIGTSAARLALLGALFLVLPGAMVAVWGIKIVPAFFAGMALSQCGFSPSGSARSTTSALLSLALAGVLTQWTPRFLPLALAPRAERMHFLLWGIGGAILLVLVVDYGARLISYLLNRTGAPMEGVSR